MHNFEVIDGLVKEYFSLDYDSYKRFHELIMNPEKRAEYIVPKLKKYLGEDQRAHFPIDKKLKQSLDNGWCLFTDVFYKVTDEFNITYEDYMSNKLKVDKQEVKLFKFVKKWYMEQEEVIRDEVVDKYSDFTNQGWRSHDEFERVFKEASEKIGVSKIPDKDLFVTISFNFADWFMVSTSESWSSCLNLQSDYEACYWTGLPGLIIDPNRVLIYITDGKSKSYRGITVKRFINRTWGLFGDSEEVNNTIVPVRYYPQKFLDGEDFLNLFPFSVAQRELKHHESFIAKRPFDKIFRNDYGESVYIYQDYTHFKFNNDNKLFMETGESAYHKLTDCDTFDEDTRYDYTEGLDGLIDAQCSISNYEDTGVYCHECGERHREDDMFYGADDNLYCESCYGEMFINCYGCGESMWMDDAHRGPDGDYYCEHHFYQKFTYCEDCGEAVDNNYSHWDGDDCLCETCYSERFTTCDECGEEVRHEDTHEHKGDWYCEKCYDEKINKEDEGVA